MNKLKGIKGIEKKKKMSLEIMLFKNWAKHGFLQSRARSHGEKHMQGMRKTPC